MAVKELSDSLIPVAGDSLDALDALESPFLPVPRPVPALFPVWVASAMLDSDGFCEFVLAGSARFVGPQFYHTRGTELADRRDAAAFRTGSLVHALILIDYAGRRIALCYCGAPSIWSDVRRLVKAWDALRMQYGIRGFQTRLREAWKR